MADQRNYLMLTPLQLKVREEYVSGRKHARKLEPAKPTQVSQRLLKTTLKKLKAKELEIVDLS